jgi:hypothetical protein
MNCITRVLQEQRNLIDEQGERIYPIICIDEIGQRQSHHIFPSDSSQEKSHLFLDWCYYLTDAKLAHVLFVTRPDLMGQLDRLRR